MPIPPPSPYPLCFAFYLAVCLNQSRLIVNLICRYMSHVIGTFNVLPMQKKPRGFLWGFGAFPSVIMAITMCIFASIM
ncbi:hypothetical protein F5Y06DRAFT_269197 [Hypoxylon sp. FL0890]|nr:hypothetical protein F5Y06DRAFT_269197 [Hypoxylon sp. FL0890]